MNNLIKIIVLLVFIHNHAFAINGSNKKIAVKSTEILSGDFFEQHSSVGQVFFEGARDYYVKANGIVDEILVDQGSYVTKGDMLISIDKSLSESKKLAAETAYKSAKSNYERDISLMQKKIISHEVLMQSEVALNKAKMELEQANIYYENMIITAPFSGKVGAIRTVIGKDVKQGDYLFSIIPLDSNKVIIVELPENLLGKVTKDSAILINDLEHKQIKGQIISISDYVSDIGTVTAKIILPVTAKLAHGSYIEPNVIFNQHKARAIPEKAILKNNQGSFVYAILDNGEIKQTYITLGIRTGDMIELLSDELKLNDKIVIEGLTKVQDGMLVEILP